MRDIQAPYQGLPLSLFDSAFSPVRSVSPKIVGASATAPDPFQAFGNDLF
jgi:hypothetical protein